MLDTFYTHYLCDSDPKKNKITEENFKPHNEEYDLVIKLVTMNH